MRHLILTFALLLALPGFGPGFGSGFGPVSATAGEGPDFNDRPSVGHPLRFTDARGHVFRPRTLIVLTRSGTLAASLPATTDNAASEDHLDLSGSPLIGQFFRRRLAPSDAVREGTPVGPVFRHGDTLVLDARAATAALTGRALILTAEFPRDGAISYHLGPISFAPSTPPASNGISDGTPAGTAYLVDGALVLAGGGGGPLITDWGKLLPSN
jgi:hypothetical protein